MHFFVSYLLLSYFLFVFLGHLLGEEAAQTLFVGLESVVTLAGDAAHGTGG
jgi:hypothetical protein